MERKPSESKIEKGDKFNFYISSLDSFLAKNPEPKKEFYSESEKITAIKKSQELGRESEEMKTIMEQKSAHQRSAQAYIFLSYAKLLFKEPEFEKLELSGKYQDTKEEVSDLFNTIRSLDLKDEPITQREQNRAYKIIDDLKSIIVEMKK